MWCEGGEKVGEDFGGKNGREYKQNKSWDSQRIKNNIVFYKAKMPATLIIK